MLTFTMTSKLGKRTFLVFFYLSLRNPCRILLICLWYYVFGIAKYYVRIYGPING